MTDVFATSADLASITSGDQVVLHASDGTKIDVRPARGRQKFTKQAERTIVVGDAEALMSIALGGSARLPDTTGTALYDLRRPTIAEYRALFADTTTTDEQIERAVYGP